MEQHDDVLCNREDRISNLFLHQPAEMRTYFEDALRYNNEKWRLLRWDAITEYYITAHSRFTAGGNIGTTGTPPGQDKPSHQPQGKQFCKIHGDNHTHTTKQCRLRDEPYNFDADACDQYRKKGVCVFHLRGMCKRPTCDLKHITKAQAIEMGLPPTTRDAVMHPIITPEEPEPDREILGNTLYGMEPDEILGNTLHGKEADENLDSVISSIMDDLMQPEKETYHALIVY